ncbi:AAA family ATPase [Nocardia sp. SYP-A9097]|uniref:AAA family ATPase n=1 Tax=Nocardia sp. SYP-A9097 TaxID=2663237 RepID=UPI00129A2427|nr:SMC family ATPase [Nocardia sp. SYP-A9097]MRH93533.1 AAA family ATPase [Nocardia sp. SYP-A9097]
MRPLTLTIKGLRSYREAQHIDFRDIGLMAIIGATGAGKSSILEGICFALYGRPTWTEESAKPLIADGGDGTATAILTFLAKGKTWQVTRTTSRKRPANHELRCLDDDHFETLDSSTDIKAKIEQLVGLTYKAFLKAVILPQGRFQALLHASDSERPAILEAVLGLEQITEVRKQAAAKQRRLEPHLYQLERQRIQLTPDPGAVIDTTTRELATLDVRITGLTSAKKTYTDAKNTYTETTEAAALLRKTAHELEQRIREDFAPRYEQLLKRHATLTPELSSAEASLDAVTVEEERVIALLARADDDGTGIESTLTLLKDLRSVQRQLPTIEEEERDLADQSRDITTDLTHLEHRLGAHVNVIERADRAEKQEAGIESEVDVASETLDQYRSLLREARRTATATATATDSENTARRAVQEATRALVDAKHAAAQACEQAEAAKTALDAANRADAAAHAAEHRGAGDPCPVCTRALPNDFQPPRTPDITEAKRLLNNATRRETVTAQKLVATERQHAAAESTLTAATEANTCTRLEYTAAVESLTATVGSVDLEQSDDALLAKPRHALDTAKTAHKVAGTAAKKAREDNIKDKAEIDTLNKAVEGRQKVLTKALAALDRRKSAALTTYSATPARYRTSGHASQESIDYAIEQVQFRKKELDQLAKELKTAQAQAKQRRTALKVVTDSLSAEVSTPAERIAAQIGVLADRAASTSPPVTAVPIPARPEPTSLVADAHWARQVIAAAELIARNCHAAATIRDQAAIHANAAMSSTLDTAQVSSTEDLDDELGKARARRIQAISDQDKAQADKPRADEIDRRIALLTPQLAVLAELHSLLSEGRFMAAVLKRRQSVLLDRASKILLDMTKETLTFHHDFSIFDCQTVQPRSAKTLSGGETFLASLALALGLIELTSSGGGRIESLFLDEGFGTLDPHTLDEAMDALTKQADAGRLVAVITHMENVAEYFDNILIVNKPDSGSRAHWASEPEREQMIDGDEPLSARLARDMVTM